MSDERRSPSLHPHPAPNPDTWPFWEWCAREELRLQRCDDCGAFRYHPRPGCPECGGADFTWERVSGRGEVWTYTVCHPPVLPAFAERAPYAAVVVQLAEGPFMVSNVVDCELDEIEIGMPVEVCFVRVDDELTLPQWRPLH